MPTIKRATCVIIAGEVKAPREKMGTQGTRIRKQLRSEAAEQLDRRLMEEINILRLEGTLFCFDPKEAKRRGGRVRLRDARNEPIIIDVHPTYGQPSVLAYKVLQAIFLKITEEGVMFNKDGRAEYADAVSFSQRELAVLVARSWSGRTSEQLYDAVLQLQTTRISASFRDKEADTWQILSFSILPTALFSGRGEKITKCSVRVTKEVVDSINKRHVAFFNLYRLSMLEPMGMVLYKRLFYYLATINRGTRRKSNLKFVKDYEDVCREWLGGLKPQHYRSRITQQLGPHLDALKATGLIRRWTIEKNTKRTGYNLMVVAGEGFFEDYELYYLDQQQPRLRFRATADVRHIQKPLELVAYFHRELGRDTNRFKDHETAYADELLERYDEHEVRDLVRYAIASARETKFEMLFFGAIKRFVGRWVEEASRRTHLTLIRERIRACRYCNESGFLELRRRHSGEHLAVECPHMPELIAQIEQEKGAERL